MSLFLLLCIFSVGLRTFMSDEQTLRTTSTSPQRIRSRKRFTSMPVLVTFHKAITRSVSFSELRELRARPHTCQNGHIAKARTCYRVTFIVLLMCMHTLYLSMEAHNTECRISHSTPHSHSKINHAEKSDYFVKSKSVRRLHWKRWKLRK